MYGKLITLEGIEGAGKTSQIPDIAAWLTIQGKTVCTTREPGGTRLGERVREILLTEKMSSETELLLMFAARAEHLKQVILPALARGEWVLCDRFTEASYAYQGAGRELGFDRVAVLEQWVQHGLRPDCVLWFDLPVTQGLQRAQSRGNADRFEQEHAAFFERIVQGYTARANSYPDRYQRINATLSPACVLKQVVTALGGLL